MKTLIYGHNHADKLLPHELQDSLIAALSTTPFHFEDQRIEDLRDLIVQSLRGLGWSDKVEIMPPTKNTITAVNGDTGLCLQLGNVARAYADLLKLQVSHERGIIESGMIIVLTQFAAKTMGSNLANFSRLVQELPYYRHIVTVPILVVGIEEDCHAIQ